MKFNPTKYKEENTQRFPQEEEQNPTFEGTQVSQLEQSGIATEKVLSADNAPVVKTPSIHYKVLEALPLDKVMVGMGASVISDTKFSVLENKFSIQENKWFNETMKKGNINSLNLVKHLISIRDNIDEATQKAQQKNIFITACRELTGIKKLIDEGKIEVVVQSSQPEPSAPEETDKKPVKPKMTKDELKAYYKELDRQMINIPVDLTLEALGANGNEDGIATMWKLWDTGDNINVTGDLWNSFNSDGGGSGSLSLVEYYMAETKHIDRNTGENWKIIKNLARNWFMENFKDEIDSQTYANYEGSKNYTVPFSMPHVLEHKFNEVRNYLHEKRGIPIWLINKQISKGHLFPGFPSDWAKQPKNLQDPALDDDNVWATFLSAHGTAAEMRAIKRNDQFSKVLAKGSIKEAGGFVIKGEKDCSERTVSALEASVDSLSYHTIYPGRNTISCMGVTYKLAVSAALEALDNNGKFALAFDNDKAGNMAAVLFKEEMINEIGVDEYKTYIQEQKIKLFDLGIRCLKEKIELGETFYLDVKDSNDGREAAIMFQEQLYQVMERGEVKHLIEQGLIKYANVCPEFNMMKNAKEEAQKVFNALNSNKPYYFRIEEMEVGENENENDVNIKKKKFFENKALFEQEFNALAQDKYAQWVEDGKIIHEKKDLAKDWNEYLIYMQKKPEFRQYLKAQEENYSGYNSLEAPVKTDKKGKKLKN